MVHSFTPHQHLDERKREGWMKGGVSRGSWGGAPLSFSLFLLFHPSEKKKKKR